MSAPHVQGWCPGALRPMLSGDGLVVRIRPPGGRLTPVQARGIATLSRRHGSGAMDLTSRANLQLRGVAESAHPALVAGLRALGLLDASARIEAARNIVVAPFWAPQDGTLEMAEALAEGLSRADAPALPAKFGFAVDCGERPVLRQASADIRIERVATGYLVRADGCKAGAGVLAQDAVPLVMALAHWFVQAGGIQAGRGRMAALLARTSLPARFTAVPMLADQAIPATVGVVAQGCLVGMAFGQLQAHTLAALADHGALRLTPWRMLLIEGATQVPDVAHTITQADDARLRVVACSGAPACQHAAAATRPLAAALAPQVPAGRLLHISGCAKGCAHPGAALTLVARGNGFDLIDNGVAAAEPVLRGLQPEAIPFHLKQFLHAPPV